MSNYINTSVEFMDKNKSLYNYIYSKMPEVINVLFPNRQKKNPEQNKKQLIEMAKNGEDRPNDKNRLNILLRSYTSKLRESYDPAFDKLIRQLAPHWFDTRLRTLKKLKAIAPKNVRFVGTYKIVGRFVIWDLVDDEYGEFKSSAQVLKKAWKKGLAGHPKRGKKSKDQHIKKPVINLSTKDVYESAAMASTSLGLTRTSVSSSINREIKCGGYLWAYYDPKKHGVKK